MMNKINLLFVTLFGIGYLKFAPGTLASLITTIILYLIFLYTSQHVQFFLFVIIVCIFFYSLTAIKSIERQFKKKDPREIVIDEVVGQMLPLLSVPIYETLYIAPKEYYCIAAFILFRLFDIWKPYPIGYVDSNVEGALGIILDDILAGIYSIIVLTIVFFILGG